MCFQVLHIIVESHKFYETCIIFFNRNNFNMCIIVHLIFFRVFPNNFFYKFWSIYVPLLSPIFSKNFVKSTHQYFVNFQYFNHCSTIYIMFTKFRYYKWYITQQSNSLNFLLDLVVTLLTFNASCIFPTGFMFHHFQINYSCSIES